jgi:trimeric autotransporter adhesin
VPFTVYPTGTAPSLSSVSVSPSSVAGGTAATGFVFLNGAAPTGGLVVPLSDDSSAVTVPASVTVPAGATGATFPVNTSAVTTATGATISATLGTTQSATLAVTPTPVPILNLISLTTQNLVGGGSATGRVALSAAALSGGAVVTLASDTPGVTVPASVTIPADATAVLFPVTTSAVTATTSAMITASFGGNMQSIQLNVRPPQTGPVLAGLTLSSNSVVGLNSVTATVTLSAPAPAGGARVFFTHNSQAIGEDVFGINVVFPAGATSASFPVDTYKVSTTMVAGLSADYGGVTQTTTLTVTPTTAAAATLSAVSLAPAGTVTLAGTVAAAGLLLPSVTTRPPLGAGALRVTVPVEELPPVTLAGLRLTADRVAAAAVGFTVSVVVCVTPP